jgi:hypothetical protein
MSKQNKVNPGTYTQAGRLSADDTAREMKKQRELSSPAQDEAEPYKPHHKETEKDKADDEEESEDGVEEQEKP